MKATGPILIDPRPAGVGKLMMELPEIPPSLSTNQKIVYELFRFPATFTSNTVSINLSQGVWVF